MRVPCYSRYIAKQVAQATLLVVLSLTSIVWLTQALRLLDHVVSQGVGMGMFLWLTLLLIPSLLLIILPVGLFFGALFTYHKLKGDSEFVALEAAGLSRTELVRPALLVAAVVVTLGYVVSLWLLPASFGKFRDLQDVLRTQYVSVLLQEGVFNTPAEGLTVFVRERTDSGTLHGILVHDGRVPSASVTMMAEEGKLQRTDSGQRFVLTNGNRQELKNGKLSLLYFESYDLDLSLYGQSSNARKPDPRTMYLPTLLSTEGLSEEEIAQRHNEIHQRILWPPYAATLALVALSLLLSGEFSRRGALRRVAIATLAGAGVLAAAVACNNAVGKQGPWMVVLAYGNVTAPLALAFLMLRDDAARWAARVWRA